MTLAFEICIMAFVVVFFCLSAGAVKVQHTTADFHFNYLIFETANLYILQLVVSAEGWLRFTTQDDLRFPLIFTIGGDV